jgi:hypothetical protein
MTDFNYITEETFTRLKAELHQMKSVDRPASSRAIAEAREKGDLKENAEYDAAKEAQGMLEARIRHLEGVADVLADEVVACHGHEMAFAHVAQAVQDLRHAHRHRGLAGAGEGREPSLL